jgi:hypothetical protein
MKNNHYTRAAVLAAISLAAAGSLHAQAVVDGSIGVDLSNTGVIYSVPTVPVNSVFGNTWTTPNSGYPSFVAPVSQFTGVNNNGSLVATADLIPLKPASITLGGTTVTDFSQIQGTKGDKGDKGDPGTQGLQGPQGIPGTNGTNGTNGLKGDKGDQGPQGIQGVPGVIQTASNGLTLTGTDVQLGGALTKTTTVDLGTNNLYFSGTGRVGIGTTSPLTPLHVAGSTNGTRNGSSSFFSPGFTKLLAGTDAGSTMQASILADAAIVGGVIVSRSYVIAQQSFTFSDSRLKEALCLSNSKNDLETIGKIEITDYKMKDKVTNGDKPFKKVIAQQVEAVFPQAVSKSTNFIPNVLKLSETSAKGDSIIVALPKEADLERGDLVRFINAQGAEEEVRLDAVDGKELTVKLTKVNAGDKVFVYGKQVNDLRAVDYDALSMLNISATQELAKKVTALEVENAKLTAALAKMDALEKAVAALEGKSNGTVTVSLTK